MSHIIHTTIQMSIYIYTIYVCQKKCIYIWSIYVFQSLTLSKNCTNIYMQLMYTYKCIYSAYNLHKYQISILFKVYINNIHTFNQSPPNPGILNRKAPMSGRWAPWNAVDVATPGTWPLEKLRDSFGPFKGDRNGENKMYLSPIGSMGLVHLPTWMVDFYGLM